MGRLLKIVDKTCGGLLLLALVFFRWVDYIIKPRGKRVLVVRLKTLGETILTLPLIKKLKDEGYEVHVLCSKENAGIFARVSLIDGIHKVEEPFKLFGKLKGFDYCIDTEPFSRLSAAASFLFGKMSIGFGNIPLRRRVYTRSVEYIETHSVRNFTRLLEPLGIEYTPEKLVPLEYSRMEEEKTRAMLQAMDLSGKTVIGMHPSTGETSTWRAWKPERWAKLIDIVLEAHRDVVVLLTGTGADKKINESVLSTVVKKDRVIDLSGKLNLGEFSYLLETLNLFVSNDTGPMHLAAAQGCRVIGLFGPNLPERFGPYGEGNSSIYKARDMECSPCINVCLYEFKNCPRNGECMDLIEVRDVFLEIEKYLGSPV